MNDESLSFTLKRKEQPLTLDGVQYLIIELDGLSRDEVMTDSMGRMELDKTGKPVSVRNFKGMQSKLVSLCLVKAEGRTKVTQATVDTWPAGTIDALFKACQRLNGMESTDKEKAEVGKELPGSAPTG